MEIESTTCCICLEEINMKIQSSIEKLECNHVLHKKCFEDLINHNKLECPLCKKMIIKAPTVINIPQPERPQHESNNNIRQTARLREIQYQINAFKMIHIYIGICYIFLMILIGFFIYF